MAAGTLAVHQPWTPRSHSRASGPQQDAPTIPGLRRTQGSIQHVQGEHPSVRYSDPSVQLNSWDSWGLSDNGTAVGVKRPCGASLTTLAVPMALGNKGTVAGRLDRLRLARFWPRLAGFRRVDDPQPGSGESVGGSLETKSSRRVRVRPQRWSAS